MSNVSRVSSIWARVGGKLAATASAVALGSASVMFLWIGLNYLGLVLDRLSHLVPQDFASLFRDSGPLMIVGLVLFVIPTGIISGRFLLRAFPPRIIGGRRPVVLSVLVILSTGIAFWYVATVLTSAAECRARSALRSVSEAQCNSLLGLVWLYWVVCVFGPSLWRHAFPRAFLGNRFVLFLRRFSTFSDREVTATVIRLAGRGVPVAFLTPALSYPRDWSPRVIGLAGFRPWLPFSRIPVFLRSKDCDWKDSARDLIERASVIVIDVSESSGAMQLEMAMMAESKCWPRTVVLAGHAGSLPRGLELDIASQGGLLIPYAKKWRFGAVRMVVAALGTAFIAQMPLEPAGVSNWLLGQGTQFGKHSPVALLATCVVASAYFLVFFAGPALDPDARRRLRKRLVARVS